MDKKPQPKTPIKPSSAQVKSQPAGKQAPQPNKTSAQQPKKPGSSW